MHPIRIGTLAALILPALIHAAPITWGPATDTTGKSQLIEGSVVHAFNAGSSAPTVTGGGASGTKTYNFTAENFTSINFTPTGGDAADAPKTSTLDAAAIYKTPVNPAMISTGDADFDSFIGTLAWANGSPSGITTGTVILPNLTPGDDYQVQVFYNDQRNDKNLTLTDGSSHAVSITSGATPGTQADDYGTHAIGSFTADSSSQELTLQSTAGNIHLTGILVVRLGNTPPPAIPSGLTAIPGNGFVTLTWDPNTEIGFDQFVVKRGTSATGPFTPLPGATPTTSTYNDGTATNDSTYYYVVSSVNTEDTESDNSQWASATPSTAINRPNIFICFLDDGNSDQECYGNTLTTTPNIDSLASAGMRFTRAYVPHPICSPSHTALFTGNYPTTLGCPHHRGPYIDKLPPGYGCLPQVLANYGYFTVNLTNDDIRWGASGKTDLNFDRNDDKTNPYPFQYLQTFTFNGSPTYDYDASTIFQGGAWANRLPGQPFFAYANIETGKAHGFGSGTTWATANGVAVDWNDVVLPPYLADEGSHEWKKEIAKYLNAVSCTDYVVGAFLEGLELTGEADNTLVVFATDHGRATMRHKQALFETGLQVPMILRWPGHIAAGSVVSDLASTIDIAPTCLAAAGVPAPLKIEGLDLLTADLADRSHLFANRDGADGFFERSRAVIGTRYKYIRHFYPEIPFINGNYAAANLDSAAMRTLLANGQLNTAQAYFLLDEKAKEEFYDLDNDPWEVNNLAGDAGHQTLLENYRRILSDQMTRTGDFAPSAHLSIGNIAPNTSVNSVLNTYGPLLEDDDGDGLSNYFETLLGLNPNLRDAHNATPFTMQANGDLQFTVRNLTSDFRYTVEISDDMIHWQPYTTLDGLTGGDPSVVNLPSSLSNPSGKLFVRLFMPQ